MDAPKIVLLVYFHRNCNRCSEYSNTIRQNKLSSTKLFYHIVTLLFIFVSEEQDLAYNAGKNLTSRGDVNVTLNLLYTA